MTTERLDANSGLTHDKRQRAVEICQALGVNENLVKAMEIHADGTIDLEVYDTRDGKPYVDQDGLVPTHMERHHYPTAAA